MPDLREGDLVSLEIAGKWATVRVVSYDECFLLLNLSPDKEPDSESLLRLDLIDSEDVARIGPPF